MLSHIMQCSLLPVLLFTLTAFASPVVTPPNGGLQGFEGLNAAGAERFVPAKSQKTWSSTRNELNKCKPVTVIFARGTLELGNVGSITGPPFFNALEDAIGVDNLAVQGVEYPANIQGYLKGGDTGGAATTAKLLEQAVSQCPDTQIVLSGYSQGAQIVQ